MDKLLKLIMKQNIEAEKKHKIAFCKSHFSTFCEKTAGNV